MAAINKAIVLKEILKIRKERRQKQRQILYYIINRRKRLLQLWILLLSLALVKPKRPRIRRCRRLQRTATWQNWWSCLWTDYSEKRFKNTLRMSRKTFMIILNKVRLHIVKSATTEEAISPEFRLGICLYRLARGDYYFTLSEMSGLGTATIQGIVNDVCVAIVKSIWSFAVSAHFPT